MADEQKKPIREYKVEVSKVRVGKDGEIHIDDPELAKLLEENGITEMNEGQSNKYVAVSW